MVLNFTTCFHIACPLRQRNTRLDSYKNLLDEIYRDVVMNFIPTAQKYVFIPNIHSKCTRFRCFFRFYRRIVVISTILGAQ